MYIFKPIIPIEPDKRGGQPCIREMRITVADILGWLASGMEICEIIEDFTELIKEDILVALEFSANRQNREVIAA
jgi:uncharacterized protein (DUF433 family)